MTRNRWIGLAVAAIVLAFLIGFLPLWSRSRSLESELQRTTHELEVARIQGRLGAALAESQRSNYERARQLMTQVFAGLEAERPRMEDPQRGQAADLILAQRDEIITQLSRAEPESVQRLMLLYTRMFAAVDPIGGQAPATVTPPP